MFFMAPTPPLNCRASSATFERCRIDLVTCSMVSLNIWQAEAS